jgi:heme/copper-type cytochrome/quinol oxidase subunit 2
MILSGIYLAWYWYNDIRRNYNDGVTGQVLTWQESTQQWIDSNRGLLAIVFSLVVIAAVTYTVTAHRRQNRALHDGS